jgi:hypothetical protein
MQIDLYITISAELACILSRLQTINALQAKPLCRVHEEGLAVFGGIMLNDHIVIDRYHCETAEAVVVWYPNACITRLYLQTLCSMVCY